MTDLPPPPASFSHINIETIAAGTELHRVHSENFAGNSFNPCQGRSSRFAPIEDPNKRCIPSLYAASTFECAVFETVFHDVPYNAKTKVVRLDNVRDRSHSQIVTNRDLTIITLYEPDLKAWGITRGLLIDTLPSCYGETTQWAQSLYRQVSDADGLIWTSWQYDPDRAMLLFGNRVSPKDLDVVFRRDATSDPALLSEIRDIGKRANITITS